MVYEYWKTKLNGEALNLYRDMLTEFGAGGERVHARNLSPEEIREVYLYLKNDHPELFQLTCSPQLFSDGRGGEYIFVSQSIYSRGEIAKRRSVLENKVTELKNRLPRGASDFEKELAVAELIIDTVDYRIDNRHGQDASSVLFAGKAQCSGIAHSVKYLCDNLAVNCITLVGTGRAAQINGSHSWNIVYIGGAPYHLDLTFNIGANKRGVKPYRYPYFNLTDRQVSSSHGWDAGTVPACAKEFKQPAVTGGGVPDITPNSNAYRNSSGAVIISSLYDFRRSFLTELDKPHNEFTFLSQIKCDDDDELMNILSQACRQCFSQKGKRYPVNIAISDKLVTLSW